MAIIIKEFNLLYKYPNSGYNTHATLLGQLSADLIIFTTLVPTQLPETKYFVYGLPHKLQNCK